MTATKDVDGAASPGASTHLKFTAYAAGPEMAAAVERRIHELCAGRPVEAHIAVVDVTVAPVMAEAANVIALPTVVRELPAPRKRVIGQLDDDRRCAEALGLDAYPRSQEAHHD